MSRSSHQPRSAAAPHGLSCAHASGGEPPDSGTVSAADRWFAPAARISGPIATTVTDHTALRSAACTALAVRVSAATRAAPKAAASAAYSTSWAAATLPAIVDRVPVRKSPTAPRSGLPSTA